MQDRKRQNTHDVLPQKLTVEKKWGDYRKLPESYFLAIKDASTP